MKYIRVLSVLMALLALPALLLHAQLTGPSLPEQSTNRRMGFPNDASAVGWNPAVLGVSPFTYDLLMTVPYGDRTADGSLLGVYGRLNLFNAFSLGAGTVLQKDTTSSQNYNAGVGFGVNEWLWAGAGVRWFAGADLFRGGEFAAGLAAQPTPKLFLGLSATNINANNNRPSVYHTNAAYSATNWLTLLGGVTQDAQDTLGGKSSLSTDLGLSLNMDDNKYVLSAQYDVVHGRLNLGFEAQLFRQFSGGVLNQSGTHPLTNKYQSFGGTALLRFYGGGDADEPGGGIDLPPRRKPGTPGGGWAPERSYRPSSVYYRIPTSDAAQTLSALNRPCNSAGPMGYDTPEALMRTIERAGPPYTGLSSTLRTMAPDPNNLYKNIRKQYYSTRVRSRELSVGDSLQLLSNQGHSINIQSVDASKAPDVAVIMQVTDSAGNSVPGLGVNDFRFKDPTLKILSVKPIDSTLNLPVDIVFLIDCSGSMSEEISAVRARVEQFVKNLETKGIDSRIGGVLYGQVVYDTLHPTADFKKFRQFANNAAAIGNDEITSSSIREATMMNFRSDAQRVFILITDDWAIQENSRLNEPDLTQALWNAHARLYSIIDPCKNNGAVMTRLSLGKEYDIKSSFNSILNEIGTDLTTSYQLVYRSKLNEPIEKVTMLRGKVKDELGRPVGTAFSLKSDAPATTPVSVQSNPTTGDYMVDLPEGKRYKTQLSGGDKYLPLNDEVNMTTATKGDTVNKDFTLMLPPTTLNGRVTDEKGTGQESDVIIEDPQSLKRIATVKTDKTGKYETQIKEGQAYRLSAKKPDYIPTPADLDATNVEKGSKLTQDLQIMSLDQALKTGATFRLKNIFFDFDKAELKPESFTELDKLVALLKEYPQINVEISAHTDGNGGDSYNQGLSERRARAVADYLVGKDIPTNRLRTKGFGKSVPIASNDTEEGRAQNRRVEFKVVK